MRSNGPVRFGTYNSTYNAEARRIICRGVARRKMMRGALERKPVPASRRAGRMRAVPFMESGGGLGGVTGNSGEGFAAFIFLKIFEPRLDSLSLRAIIAQAVAA